METWGDIGRTPRLAARVLAAAAAVFCLGGSDVAPRVDAAMIDRVLAGAEWLVARSDDAKKTDPELLSQIEMVTPEATDLLDRLLILRRTLGDKAAGFDGVLVEAGYGLPETAFYEWLDEAQIVVSSVTVADLDTNRPVVDIEAEIMRLPSVPLDAHDAEIREGLYRELDAAVMSARERRAVAGSAARIDELRTRLQARAGQ